MKLNKFFPVTALLLGAVTSAWGISPRDASYRLAKEFARLSERSDAAANSRRAEIIQEQGQLNKGEIPADPALGTAAPPAAAAPTTPVVVTPTVVQSPPTQVVVKDPPDTSGDSLGPLSQRAHDNTGDGLHRLIEDTLKAWGDLWGWVAKVGLWPIVAIIVAIALLRRYGHCIWNWVFPPAKKAAAETTATPATPAADPAPAGGGRPRR